MKLYKIDFFFFFANFDNDIHHAYKTRDDYECYKCIDNYRGGREVMKEDTNTISFKNHSSSDVKY